MGPEQSLQITRKSATNPAWAPPQQYLPNLRCARRLRHRPALPGTIAANQPGNRRQIRSWAPPSTISPKSLRRAATTDTALRYLEQSLHISQEIGDKSGMGTTLNNISGLYWARGDYDTALRYLEQSLQISQEIGDKSGMGATLNNISQIFKARGDYDTALRYLEQSLHISQEIGDKSGMGATLNNISQLKARRPLSTAPALPGTQSLHISQEIGDKSGISNYPFNNISCLNARAATTTPPCATWNNRCKSARKSATRPVFARRCLIWDICIGKMGSRNRRSMPG
ncbi:MAG: tetratricopeptide repeat protein [Anaerolineae bacterium]|nr:tetratricopeptide repeat protein [Anaerolineae bacterium]